MTQLRGVVQDPVLWWLYIRTPKVIMSMWWYIAIPGICNTDETTVQVCENMRCITVVHKAGWKKILAYTFNLNFLTLFFYSFNKEKKNTPTWVQ